MIEIWNLLHNSLLVVPMVPKSGTSVVPDPTEVMEERNLWTR
jgi:hypothetical protein